MLTAQRAGELGSFLLPNHPLIITSGRLHRKSQGCSELRLTAIPTVGQRTDSWLRDLRPPPRAAPGSHSQDGAAGAQRVLRGQREDRGQCEDQKDARAEHPQHAVLPDGDRRAPRCCGRSEGLQSRACAWHSSMASSFIPPRGWSPNAHPARAAAPQDCV